MSSKKNKKQFNNKVLSITIAILILVVLGFLLFPKLYADERNQTTVQELVEKFGKRMQYVNLLEKNTDNLSINIEEQYGKLVESPLLLLTWMNNPQNAPGRLEKDSWPDRIEILSTEKISDTQYEIKGNVVEISKDNLSENCNGAAGVDTEIEGCVVDGFAYKRPISIKIDKSTQKGKPWLITEVTMGQYKITNEPNWQSTFNESQSFTYSYPSKFDTEFVKIKNLPPEVTASKNINSKLVCKTTKKGSELEKTVVKETINESEYCITTESEGMAGASYKNYTYTTFNNDFGLVEVKMSLEYPNCDNYGTEEEKQSCKTEQENFDLNSIVDKMVNSLE